ncbi:MAG TPA: hypothetical protein VFV34_16980, partial [Blastocatellia bacterium]|nr:hypothetical protein [Blastocatellia bacterium]
MTIKMQGSWTVQVKSKNAAFPQRFLIDGADSINGASISHQTFPGTPTTPPVEVDGNNWTITIQNDPGTGFQDSDDRIKFPAIAGLQYQFDIESNDAGADQDFNDLILRCRTPRTPIDFVLYGNVSYYGSGCILNPCFRRFVVIDTLESLREALKTPVLREPIEALYPERIPRGPIPPGPTPDPPFRPLVIPLDSQSALPPKLAQVLKVTDAPTPTNGPAKAKRAEELPTRSVSVQRTVPLSVAEPFTKLAVDRLSLAGLIDRLPRLCDSGPLGGFHLRFLEYDRTNAELAGGAYTGTGNRRVLGTAVTDANGNYIFRFSLTLGDVLQEVFTDIAVGEDALVQVMPDIIVQVLDPMAPGGVLFETAPFFNVPLFKRIDICVPKSKLPGGPRACIESQIIQAIGDITVGPGAHPDGTGARVGFNNSLNADGLITARNSNAPPARCAAWAGTLSFFACLSNPAIKYYTIRFKKRSESGWHFLIERYEYDRVDGTTQLVGPFDISLSVDGGPLNPTKAYHNIETESGWLPAFKLRKAQISSAAYEPAETDPQEPILFRIEGYRADGTKFAGADDIINLYIDNTAPDYALESVAMVNPDGTLQHGDECALFTVPATNPGAPMRVRFRANDRERFLNAYGVSIRKGNPPPGAPAFNFAGTGPGAISGAYSHSDDLACSSFEGTFDDPTHSITGSVTSDIVPGAGAP